MFTLALIGTILLAFSVLPLVGLDPLDYIIRRWPIAAVAGTAAVGVLLIVVRVYNRNLDPAIDGSRAKEERRSRIVTWALLLAALAATIVFDLTGLGFGALAGLAVFVGCVIDDFSGIDGLHLLLVASALFVASFAVSYVSDESLVELARSTRLPYFASATGICGLCLVMRSLVTGQWRPNENT